MFVLSYTKFDFDNTQNSKETSENICAQMQ